MIEHFVRCSELDPTEFDYAYKCLSLQRNLRILGVFARLSLVHGKPNYIDLIPRVWSHVTGMLDEPGLEDLRALFLDVLPTPSPEFLSALKDQCGTHPLPS